MELDLCYLDSSWAPRRHNTSEHIACVIGHKRDVSHNSQIQREGHLEHALNLFICCVSHVQMYLSAGTLTFTIHCVKTLSFPLSFPL